MNQPKLTEYSIRSLTERLVERAQNNLLDPDDDDYDPGGPETVMASGVDCDGNPLGYVDLHLTGEVVSRGRVIITLDPDSQETQ